jgi:putative AbiEi antitoxin of type IV toxin-antitoxin system/uncharacterized protein DUF559
MADWHLTTGNRKSADIRLAELASEAWGVLSVEELRGCGLSYQGIQRRERAGRLIRLYPGVYAVGHVSEAPESAWLAAVKACGPGAALSHPSAGELWEFLEPEDHLPHVTVRGNRRLPRIRIHRSTCLDRRDVTRHRGIPVTTAARTLIDLAAVLNETALRQAVRRAQGLRWVSIPQLLETMDRLGSRRGTATLRRIIATGPAPTRSVLEEIVLDLLLGAGFEHPDVNEPIRVDGRRLVPDFRWPRERLIVEADGAAWHDRHMDAERQALLEAHGERVIRVTWEQATLRRSATIARVANAGAPR